MITSLVRMCGENLANVLGFTIEWLQEEVQRYFDYLIKTFIRFLVGVGVGLALLWLSTRVESYAIPAGAGVLVMGFSFVVLAAIKAPLDLGLETAAAWWPRLQPKLDMLVNILFTALLSVFYVVFDQAPRHPFWFSAYMSCLVILWTAMMMPGETKIVSFFREKFKYLILIPVLGLTSVRVYAATKPLWQTPDRIAYFLDDVNQIHSGQKIIHPFTEDGTPFMACVPYPHEYPHCLYYYPGQHPVDPDTGIEILPVTVKTWPDILKAMIQARDENKAAMAIKVPHTPEVQPDPKPKSVEQPPAKTPPDSAPLQNIGSRTPVPNSPSIVKAITPVAPPPEFVQRQPPANPNYSVYMDATIVSVDSGYQANNQIMLLAKPQQPIYYNPTIFQPDLSLVQYQVTSRQDLPNNQCRVLLVPVALKTTDQAPIHRAVGISPGLGEPVYVTVSKQHHTTFWDTLAGAAVGGAIGGKKGAVVGAGAGAATSLLITANNNPFKGIMVPLHIKKVSTSVR